MKTIHFAAKISEDGQVSATCFKKPRAINLKLASWTNRREAVTCPACKSILGIPAVARPFTGSPPRMR